MTAPDDISVTVPERNRFEVVFDYALVGLSVVMMALGLRQWAVLVGMIDGPAGSFQAMGQEWQLATMYLAVVDIVAAVGLWMRVSWGRVLWILAALSEIALHTVFFGTFGGNLLIVAFHTVTLAALTALYLLAQRPPRASHQGRS